MQHGYFKKLLYKHSFLTNDKKYSTHQGFQVKSTAMKLYFHLTKYKT